VVDGLFKESASTVEIQSRGEDLDLTERGNNNWNEELRTTNVSK
jgi:hypothetical protein